jgi:isopentenyldiphosphate isomerase
MTMAEVENELVDVLDDGGNVTGTATRAEVRARNLMHRSVFVAVVNEADELLVHRRADWKDVWPGAWDVAFGGVVEAGEPWELAASRELHEEAGITAELSYLGEDVYRDDTVRELARIYLARHDGPVDLSDGEVVETRWVPLDGLRGWLEGRTLCPDSRELVVPRLDAP